MKKCILMILYITPVFAKAQLELAKIFTDNMILQREERIHIWGKAAPYQKVQIHFAEEIKSTVVLTDSSWSLYFKKQKANFKPQTITIDYDGQKIELRNILIGDVWIALGQSNMEWPMIQEMHWKDEIKNADQPLIRFINPPPAGRYVYGVSYNDSLNRRLTNDSFYLWNKWKTSNSTTVKDMSAVAYYFAKSIVEKVNIPLGIINLSIGGAPIETFISREALKNSGKFAVKLEGNWLENPHLPEWIRQRGRENVGNNINSYGDETGPNHAYKPGFAFESGIKPLLPFPVKGIIWYQGESNSLEKERVEEYRELLHLMITDYRQKWKNPTMPFYWVQLSSIDTAHYHSRYWPQFRDEQRKLLDQLKNVGMAVSSDAGSKNDVHPRNKKIIGERLALWALKSQYSENIMPSGPLPLKASYKKNKVIISFQYSGARLRTANGNAIHGFSLDGITNIPARINKKKIIIDVKEKPNYVFYGWKPYSDANLVNGDALPASTFKMKVK